jgi:hypothetical protein
MKKLTLLPRMMDFEVSMLENLVGELLPKNFTDFIREYSNISVKENCFQDKRGEKWVVTKFWDFKNIFGLTEEFKEKLERRMVAFGYDPGGWSFCLSMEEDKNSIYIYRWTDEYNPAFLKIANSFEDFIDSLQPSGG